jgi:ligand-binding sensor domain-containing protein/signal transduction histidine kinase
LRNSSTFLNAPKAQYRFLYWLAFAAVFLVRHAYAIDPNRAMSQYVRNHWGTESGFPKGPVYSITQTKDGYLWIGTEAGLVRFDGVKFQLVKDASASFAIKSVLGLMPDDEGALWVRLHRPTLLRFQNGKFENVMPVFGRPSSTVTAMNRTQNGKILLWVLEGEGSAIIKRGNKFETIAATTGLSRSPVMAIADMPNGDTWIGTRDVGLYRLRGGQVEAITKGLPDLKVNCLLSTASGELWVGTDRGIVRWNGIEFTQSGIPASLSHIQALALTIDRDSNIWVGTNSQGLLRINSQGVSTFTEGARGTSEAVTAVFEDREGNIWIGSANGIVRLRDSVFVSYSTPEGLPSENNGPVYVDSESRLWFAPIAGGLYCLNNRRIRNITDAGLGKDVVYSLAGGGDDLWIGRQRGGLTRLRMRGNSVTAVTYQQKDGLAQNSVYAVHRARDGTVWAGTLSGGISRFREGKFTTYTNESGLASNTIASILEGSDGTMWFATPNGLSSLAQGRWHTFKAADGLPSELVNCLLEDSTGVLWIGTADGLAYLRSGRIQLPADAPESLQGQILGMAQDVNGSFWVTTSKHVVRVDRNKLMSGGLTDMDVREFGLADGLHGEEGVKRHRSVVVDPLGRIWFSLNRGLSVVAPDRLTRNSAPALVHIQSISADGNLIDSAGTIRIPSARQRITFDYTGLSLAIPERVKFRYRLDGFDHGWSNPLATREAVYTNLGPGSYNFRVIASNTDGIWNSGEAVIGFQIEPMYWQTWWFRLSLVLAGILTVLALYRIRLRQLTRQMNVRFEERLAERMRIAQELHDTLLQGFLGASMQLHVAVDNLPADSPAKPMLGRIINLIGQVIEEGRNAIRGIRSTSHNAIDLEQAFYRIRQELALQKEIDEPISFRVIVEGQPRTLHPMICDEAYRIGREALVNAFHHSRAGNIEVELEYAANQLRILVRDDGCGIDPEVLRAGRTDHWGLSGMHERAGRIGARLKVRSDDEGGTEVELSVPGQIAFESQSNHRSLKWLAGLSLRRAKPGMTSERKKGN